MKKCTKCGVEKELAEFTKFKRNKDGLRNRCKQCDKEYRKNPEEFNKKHAKVIPEGKKWCNRCKEFKNYDQFGYNKNYKDNHSYRCKQCSYDNNKFEINLKAKQARKSNAIFKIYNNKLTIDEDPILAEDGISLKVKCKHCQKYFIPTKMQVRNRLQSLNGSVGGSNFIYCSKKCKNSCSIYNQKEWPKDFNTYEKLPYTQSELDIWAKIVKANNESGLCEVCGINIGNIAHHELPKKTYPQYALDITNGIAICEECHKKLHTGACSTGRLANMPCKLK